MHIHTHTYTYIHIICIYIYIQIMTRTGASTIYKFLNPRTAQAANPIAAINSKTNNVQPMSIVRWSIYIYGSSSFVLCHHLGPYKPQHTTFHVFIIFNNRVSPAIWRRREVTMRSAILPTRLQRIPSAIRQKVQLRRRQNANAFGIVVFIFVK